jgi:hypothetical protein
MHLMNRELPCQIVAMRNVRGRVVYRKTRPHSYCSRLRC